MNKTHFSKSLASLVLMLLATQAMASTPVEKIVCTEQSNRTGWLSESKIRSIMGEQDFTLLKLKVSRGNCYEFYGVHHNGSLVEAYYHPISGEVLRYNRVQAAGNDLAFDAHAQAATADIPGKITH